MRPTSQKLLIDDFALSNVYIAVLSNIDSTTEIITKKTYKHFCERKQIRGHRTDIGGRGPRKTNTHFVNMHFL